MSALKRPRGTDAPTEPAKATMAAHPYRASLVGAIESFPRSLGPDPSSKDASAYVRKVRHVVDAGGGDGLPKHEMARLIAILSAARDEVRRRWTSIEKVADWVGGAVGTAGVVPLILQLPFATIFMVLAMLVLILARLMAISAKRWLDVAEELNGLVKDLRDVSKALPSDPRAMKLNPASVERGLAAMLTEPISDDPEPGAGGIKAGEPNENSATSRKSVIEVKDPAGKTASATRDRRDASPGNRKRQKRTRR